MKVYPGGGGGGGVVEHCFFFRVLQLTFRMLWVQSDMTKVVDWDVKPRAQNKQPNFTKKYARINRCAKSVQCDAKCDTNV